MKEFNNKYNLLTKTIVFAGLPVLIWLIGDFPRRSTLKETISILTLLAFSAMVGQFFLTRGYRTIHKELKMSSLVRLHKFFGYIFIPIIFVHPFLIVLPRYFESGVQPLDAFGTIITQFNSLGVILGLIAWTFMISIGITSLLRSKIFMSYKTWRVLHGILSILFISIAAWHVIDLGRHTDLTMSIFFIIISTGGIILLIKNYFLDNSKSGVVWK
ncbi:MAG: ferric reductase-like transmembrane domain-containing protein [Melioribacteraceae bacterium]|nr:ferric reductase-like transmembrane domain-containing protein [Melioribacteraceae bacterium]